MSSDVASKVEKLGGVVIFAALVWWFLFFMQVAHVTGDKPEVILQNTYMCIVYTTQPCALIYGIAQLAGYTAYTPIIAWAGIALIVVGRIFDHGSSDHIHIEREPPHF